MAKRKEETKTAEVTEKVVEPTQEQGYKKWEEKSNAERLESINTYYKMILAKSIGEKKTFWNKDMSQKEIDNSIPYNASTGKPYSGITSLVLRAAKELNGYEDSNFLTMKQANLMHGTLKYTPKFDEKTGEIIKNENGEIVKDYVKGIKMTYLQDYEYKPKLDKEGKPMTREVKKENGEIEKVPVLEKVFLKNPKLETITLYHISQFDNLNIKQLKSRNLEPLNKYREEQKERPYDLRAKVGVLGLSDSVTQDLNNFLTSQMKGIDYHKIQHQSLSQIKQQERTQTQEQGRSL